MRSLQQWIETVFETFLFNARLIVILAVLGSLTSSVLMFVRGAILIVHSTKDFAHHWKDPHGEELSIALISSVDSFLFATVLLIFAMGIYELFISKIDPASRTEESRPNWLQIHSLDDLKGAVGKVILMILIVRLFESAVKMKYDTPLHLLFLGLAVLFVAAALYLQHLGHKHDKPHVYPSDRKSEHKDEHGATRDPHLPPGMSVPPPHAAGPHHPMAPSLAPYPPAPMHASMPAHMQGAMPPPMPMPTPRGHDPHLGAPAQHAAAPFAGHGAPPTTPNMPAFGAHPGQGHPAQQQPRPGTDPERRGW